MAGYEQKPGDLAIFKEREKRNERGPDWRGTMVVPEGVKPGDKLEVAVWAKGNNGTMLAGSVKPERQRDSSFPSGGGGNDRGGGGRVPRDDGDDPFGDSIPFIRSDSLS